MDKQAIADVITRQIAGRKIPGWSCCCGSIKRGPTTVVRAIPPEDNAVMEWYMWSAEIVDEVGNLFHESTENAIPSEIVKAAIADKTLGDPCP